MKNWNFRDLDKNKQSPPQHEKLQKVTRLWTFWAEPLWWRWVWIRKLRKKIPKTHCFVYFSITVDNLQSNFASLGENNITVESFKKFLKLRIENLIYHNPYVVYSLLFHHSPRPFSCGWRGPRFGGPLVDRSRGSKWLDKSCINANIITEILCIVRTKYVNGTYKQNACTN